MLRKTFCFFFLLIVAVVVLPAGAHGQTTVVYSFPADSLLEVSSLIQASDGNFYGTAVAIDDISPGLIFRLSQAGEYSTLYSFPLDGSTGDTPESLIQGGDGNLYGITQRGGANQEGTFFQITASGEFTTLYSFDPAVVAYPVSIVQGADGNLYGVAKEGASAVGGAFFKLTTSGQATLLHVFNNDTDGSSPNTGLIQGSDGNFYGATLYGGQNTCFDQANTCGTVFKITPSGTLTTLLNLSGTYDSTPNANALAEGFDHVMYDTSQFGGASSEGSFFNIPAGDDLYDFGANLTAGVPSAVVLASDRVFYGTTLGGGTFGSGTVFRITSHGGLTNLYSFTGQPGQGGSPSGISLEGSNGNLYGGTENGGASCDNGCGAIFRTTLSIPPPVQVSFSSSTPAINEPVTLTWKVLNAPSLTFQQCYAFVQNEAQGAGTWTGLQTGTTIAFAYQGSETITPTAAGVYTYALTCGGVESGFGILRVGNGKAATATSLQATDPVVIGSVVTLVATPSTQQNIGTITGSVTFHYGSLSLGTVNLTNGTASLNVTAQGIPTGTYDITATYSGDSNYQPSSGTTTVTVLGYATSTTLIASPIHLTQGQATTLSATVARTSVSGTPSGNVTFSYGSTALGSAKLSGGVATFMAATDGSIAPGTYAVTAQYDGDATDQISFSTSVNVTVIAATSTSLTVSPNPVPKDSAVTLTATVERSYNVGVPAGTVTFSVGSYVVGTKTLDGTGTAVVNASDVGIPAGTYPVTATYSGDSANGNAGSSSPVVEVTVQ